MPGRAPRRPLRPWQHLARGAGRRPSCVAALVIALAMAAVPGAAQTITAAEFEGPTDAYPHGVLGDDLEWSELHVTITRSAGSEGGIFHGHASLTYRVTPPGGLVYEDLQPRLWDVTGDGKPEVVVVESDPDMGARLAVIGVVDGMPDYVAATPHIGTRFRWLAPVGAADFDGDGHVEIAFVDRPHLVRTLRVWRFTGDAFFEIAHMDGLTNHRIGEDIISGGVRDCGQGPEMIVMDADWSWIMAARLTPARFFADRIAPFRGPASVDDALDCR